MRLPKQFVMAMALALFSAQVASVVYVRANTEAASDAMLRGTPLGQILVWSMLNGNNPKRSDLTDPTVPHDVFIARLRDYANQRLIWDLPPLLIVGLFLAIASRIWPGEITIKWG